MGSGDVQGIEALMRVAHLIVVPVQPNGWDVWTVELLDDLAADALEVNEDLRVTVVLNRASPSRREPGCAGGTGCPQAV